MSRTAMIAAIAVAVLGAVLFMIRKKRYIHEVTGGEMVGVIRLVESVEEGQPILHDALSVTYRPARFVEPRHIEPRHALSIIGLRAVHSLTPGSTLVWSDLAQSRERTGTNEDRSAAIREGYRATTVQIDSSHFGRLLRGGDRVDVFYTALQGGVSKNTTVLLAQNVAVITDSIMEEYSRRNTIWRRSITLSTDPQQATAIQHASMNGHISFAVRHREDDRIVDELPYVTAGDLVQAAEAETLNQRRRRPRPTTPQIERL